MEKYRYRSVQIFNVTIVSTLVIFLIIGSSRFFLDVSADRREFEVERFNENITIPSGNIGSIEFDIQEDNDIEIVYAILVKQGLPIDAYFVTEDNYLLLISDSNFLYLIDGSQREFVYTKKILSLTEQDLYMLVMTNYNNQSVEVNVVYEIRTYQEETSSEDFSFFLYILLVAVIILAILLIVLLLKTRRNNRALLKDTKKTSSTKAKKSKIKKAKSKKSKVIKKEPAEAPEPDEAVPEPIEEQPVEQKKAESGVSKENPPGFCGYCGKPITTPFCSYCGRKV